MDTVLFMESNLNQQLLYSEELHRAGWEVICVSNRAETIQAAENTRVDCFVLDMRLPYLDGATHPLANSSSLETGSPQDGHLEDKRAEDESAEDESAEDDDGENGDGIALLSYVRRHWPAIPVIVYTTQATSEKPEVQHLLKQQGATACLLKNSDPARLVSKVRQSLHNTAAQRATLPTHSATLHRNQARSTPQSASRPQYASPLYTDFGRNPSAPDSASAQNRPSGSHADMRVDPYDDSDYAPSA